MTKEGHRPAERFEDFDLHTRIGDVVFAADDVRNLEVDVVNDAWQRVKKGAVFADQHRIAQRGRVDRDMAAHKIGPILARAGELKTPVRLAAFRFELGAVFGAELQRSAIIDRRLAGRLRDLAFAVEFILGLVRRIEQPRRLQLIGGLLVLGEAVRLVGALLPMEPEPSEIILDALLELFGRAGKIGVVDTQEDAAALRDREEPVHQRSAYVADMDASRRGRRETEADGHYVRTLCGKAGFMRRAAPPCPACFAPTPL